MNFQIVFTWVSCLLHQNAILDQVLAENMIIVISDNLAVYLLVTLILLHSLCSVTVLIFEVLSSDVFIRLVYLHLEMQTVSCSCSCASY